VDVLSNPSSLTVDYQRDMADGKRGGAFIRVVPKPLGGSVVVMTVPVSQAVGSAQVAQVLEEELRTLLTLI
jgi:hypothetical protein